MINLFTGCCLVKSKLLTLKVNKFIMEHKQPDMQKSFLRSDNSFTLINLFINKNYTYIQPLRKTIIPQYSFSHSLSLHCQLISMNFINQSRFKSCIWYYKKLKYLHFQQKCRKLWLLPINYDWNYPFISLLLLDNVGGLSVPSADDSLVIFLLVSTFVNLKNK